MCGEKISLAEKVGVTPDSAIFARSKVQFFDDLSDDEEYQNMTEEERNERMKPKLDFGNNLFCLEVHNYYVKQVVNLSCFLFSSDFECLRLFEN